MVERADIVDIEQFMIPEEIEVVEYNQPIVAVFIGTGQSWHIVKLSFDTYFPDEFQNEEDYLKYFEFVDDKIILRQFINHLNVVNLIAHQKLLEARHTDQLLTPLIKDYLCQWGIKEKAQYSNPLFLKL